MPTDPITPLAVACPYPWCSGVGVDCVTAGGTPRPPHVVREEAADKAEKLAAKEAASRG